MTSELLVLVVLTLAAAIVNGALGYGFSSITVPVALLFLTNRVLNPALVLDRSRPQRLRAVGESGSAPARVAPRAAHRNRARTGRASSARMIVSSVSPDWLKFGTFAVLLPLILRAGGRLRRPIQRERAAGLVFGGGRRRALLGDDDLRAAARDCVEQPGVGEAGVPRGARVRAAGRIQHDGRGLRVRRALHGQSSALIP